MATLHIHSINNNSYSIIMSAWGVASLQPLIDKVRAGSVAEVHVFSSRKVRADDWPALFNALAANRSVKRLAISGHALPPAAIEPLQRVLASHPALSNLAILPRSATDSDLACLLSTSCPLTTLDLSSKSIASPAPNLAQLLSLNSLRHVDLSGNPLTTLAIDGHALAHLESLCLADTQLTSAAVASLLGASSGLRSLDLSGVVSLGADQAIAHSLAQGPSSLTCLRLAGTAAGTDTLLSALQMPSLQELYLGGCTGTVNLTSVSTNSATLRVLDLSRTTLQPVPTPADLSTLLALFPALERLDLSECSLDHEHLCAILSSAPALVRLSFRGNSVSQPLAPSLSAAACAVQTIDLTSTSLTLAVVRSLLNLKVQLQLPQLATLEIGANPCTESKVDTGEDQEEQTEPTETEEQKELRELEEWARSDPSVSVALVWRLGAGAHGVDGSSNNTPPLPVPR
ncbi:hypothetical protein RI367_007613 [Sorochytrium milnesiophthora]